MSLVASPTRVSVQLFILKIYHLNSRPPIYELQSLPLTSIMSVVHTTIMKKRQCLLFIRAVQSAMWWSLGSRKSYLPCKYACYKSRAIREVAVAPGFHVGPSSVGPSVRQLLGSPRQHAIQPSPPPTTI